MTKAQVIHHFITHSVAFHRVIIVIIIITVITIMHGGESHP